MKQQAATVTTIDLGLCRPNMASSHLLVVGTSASLIDVGATQYHKKILEALQEKQISFAAVKFIFVTHIHLDHAGAAGFLLGRFFPNARLVVHPFGAAHMRDPAKLEAAAQEVYGPEYFARVYGSLDPVPAERVIVAADGMEFDLEGGEILMHEQAAGGLRPEVCARVIHTPGHARHHYCLYLPKLAAVFTGDAYGLAYPELNVDGKAFVFPSTTPAAFEPKEMLSSVEKIASLGANQAFLTHFGLLPEPSQYLEILKSRIVKLVELCTELENDFDQGTEATSRILELKVKDWLNLELEKHRCDVKMSLEILEMDIKLNVQGLLAWLARCQRDSNSG